MITLIILNEEISDIIKVVKSFEESGLLIKGISRKINYEAKEQRAECYQVQIVLVYQEIY